MREIRRAIVSPEFNTTDTQACVLLLIDNQHRCFLRSNNIQNIDDKARYHWVLDASSGKVKPTGQNRDPVLREKIVNNCYAIGVLVDVPADFRSVVLRSSWSTDHQEETTMTRYLSVLFCVLALTLIVNDPAVYAADQLELTKKEKRIIKRIARKIAKKQANKKVNAILPIETPNLATEAVTTPKIETGAVTTSELADGAVISEKIADEAVTLAKLSADLQGGRKFYVTPTQHPVSAVLTACAVGYHMASMFEMLDVSHLRYDTVNGFAQVDSGQGPPTDTFGWVRTGSSSGTGTNPGQANCAAWSSSLETDEGTMVSLRSGWFDNPVTNPSIIHPWSADTSKCDVSRRIWCVQD